jgi:glyoxylase I family protein
MRGLVHHIDLSVSDLERSRTFYDAVLGYLGYTRAEDYPNGSDWNRASEPFHSIGIVRASGPNASRTHDRLSPGLHHLAWMADSNEDVDALHALLQQSGAEILDPPSLYPQYGSDYYAVFFADPDGLKLEFVAGRTEHP